MNKKLLLTSDDFGMCHSVNLGIVKAMTQGICRSTNFLAPSPWFSEAVELAKENKLEVGVHLCLTCDWDRLKWGPITANPRLKTEDGSLPSLHTGLETLGATDDDIYDELKAQIMLVKKRYGEPTQLDTHMIGGEWQPGIRSRVQRVIKRLSGEFKIGWTYERDEKSGRLKNFVAEDCLSATPDKREYPFETLAKWNEPGKYHLYGHAAVDSAELHSVCSSTHPSRMWAADVRLVDMEFFTNPETKRRIEAMGFELIGIREALAA